MDRRLALSSAGLAGILAAGAAPAIAQNRIQWKLSSSFPESLDTIYGSANVMATKVKEMSGGKFEILVHPAGKLTKPFEVVDALGKGSIEIAHTAPYYFTNTNEAFAIGCAIPFGLNSRQMTSWMMEGNGLKLMREFYANYNIVNFPGGNTGAQMGGWYRKEIKSLADIKGLKMRMGGFAGKVFSRMGGVPLTLPGGEILSAFEKGTIDAAEWVGPYDDQKLGLQKAAPFYHYPGWWEGGPQIDFFVGQTAYKTLSAENKAIFESACAYAHLDMQAKYDARNSGALQSLVASGTKLRPFSFDVMESAFKESMALYDEIGAKNPAWKKIYADYSKFRSDANVWFRFTEARFDQFMQSHKL
jgi:TRAP-type mannitol/chloroaromatic compound transport system substrate-binding protein